MDDSLNLTSFEPFPTRILPRFGFEEMRRSAQHGEFAVDYANERLVLRLLHDHDGDDVLLAARDTPDDLFAPELVITFLTGQSLRNRSMEQLARLFAEHYMSIVTLFSRAPDSKWGHFTTWLNELNRKRFRFDRVRKHEPNGYGMP